MEATTKHARGGPATHTIITRIAAGMDGFSEGEDAAALASALAQVTGAELLLVAVHSEPLILPPIGVSWAELRTEAKAMLRRARAEIAPGARTVLETDFSVPRALHRVVHRERRDLLVIGSSRHGPKGRIRIGTRTRQLLCNFQYPLAVAPRGYLNRDRTGFVRIGTGYDGSPESRAALDLAASIAVAAGAELEVDTVVDDRIPATGWWPLGHAAGKESGWEDAALAEVERRRAETEAAARASGASGRVEIRRGRPADALLELSKHVDLLVIGSRRWGPVSRLLLGSTGEALLHDAACPVVVVPRPAG